MTTERGKVCQFTLKWPIESIKLFMFPINLAKLYSAALIKAADVPVEVGDKIGHMTLPVFANDDRIRR